MAVFNNIWVSPVGQEYRVQNHTSWLEQALKVKLPPVDFPEHEIEKNKLYDMAYGLGWLRAQADTSKNALYVDPQPSTGHQWRWIARRGAADHSVVFNSDGKELANFQPGKRRKYESVVRRLELALGPHAYVEEALDPRQWILDQPPQFNIFQSGQGVWGVSMPGVVPVALARVGYLSHNPIIGYLRRSDSGMWRVANFSAPFDGQKASTVWGLSYPTGEAAAEAMWRALKKDEARKKAPPPDVRDWILNLKEPRPRDLEWQVVTCYNDGSEYVERKPFRSLDGAAIEALRLMSFLPHPYTYPRFRIQKVYKPSGSPLVQYWVTPGGGLRPINEAMNPKDFILQQAGKMVYFVNEYTTNEHSDSKERPLRIGYETEIEHDQGKARDFALQRAQRAANYQQLGIVRVELECWNVPASYDQDAVLEHTYWAKPDGTFEEIPVPADPTRIAPPG